ncbi:hypothetical protein JCM3766R1_006147 [Sporobolomyces carnicolor]
MLARGAACDTCRARKVKCDALRPHCSPCLKSARGDATLAAERCAYEGTSVAIATANRAAEIEKNGGTKRKKRQPRNSVPQQRHEQTEDAESVGGSTRKRKKRSSPDDDDDAAADDNGSAGADRERGDDVDDARHGSMSLGPEDGGSEATRARNAPVQRGGGGFPRFGSNQLPSVFMNPSDYAHQHPMTEQPYQHQYHHQHYSRLGGAESATSSWQPSIPQPAPANRFTLPAQAHPDRSAPVSDGSASSSSSSSKEREQLADRVAELERQLKLQGESHSAPLSSSLNRSTVVAPITTANSYSSTYASPAAGARSPSFPYATYSSYNPPTPGYGAGSFGSSTYSMNPPSSSSLLGPSNALSYSASSNSQQQQQYPPIQLPPPNLSSSSSSFPQAAPIPLPLSSLPSFDPGRRRSLSTLSAIAGAVGMDEYNHHHHHHHPSSSSSSSTWSASHQEGGGGATSYRFSTSSPVSSTRHLGTEPQAFALTSSNSASPGRSNWNPTTSSLRTEMTTTTTAFDQNHTSTGSTSDRYRNVEVAADVTRAASPRTTTAASSSVPSVSSLATSPSTTTLPASVKAPSPSTTPPIAHGLENATTTISGDSTSYFEPFELDPPDGFPLLDLSYPPSLPPLAVLHHLVSTFFKRAAVPSTMLSKAKLLFALGLSPTDPRWPDEALLHSICAYACMFVSDETLGAGEYGGLGFDPAASGLRYWEIEGDATARDYHYKKAKDAIEQALLLNARRAASSSSSSMHHPRNLFQVLQAVVLVCYVAYLSAQFSDLWLLAGTATRLIAPLGLNHLEPWDFDRNRSGPPYQDWGIRVRKTERNELLGPAKDLAEHWERSCTFWLAFAVDRFASANTDWTTSIDEKDISTHLPCTATRPLTRKKENQMPGLSIDPYLCHIPSLYLASPSFLSDTQAPIGSLGLYIKATILLGRVVNYTQRFPRYLRIPPGETCSSIKKDIKAGADFIELDVSISKFKASHSANFFDNASSTIDGFLASAYVIPHVATILLHETLTDRYDRNPSSSLQRCLVAAKCIINSTYILYQSSYDLGGVDPFLPFCWSVAGRALVRDYSTRQFWGEHEEADTAKQLAEHCLSFTQHCAKSGSRIAQRLTETLRGHLENPESLLPLDAGCNVVFDLNDVGASRAYAMDEVERQSGVEPNR